MRDGVADKGGSEIEVGALPPDRARSGVRPALSARETLAPEHGAVRFLVVDDDEFILRRLAPTLASYANVDTATNIEDARRLLAAHEYTLVLVDVGLPERPAKPEDGLDPASAAARASMRVLKPLPPRGVGLAREARASCPRATIVLFTGGCEDALPVEARRLSRVSVVLKPWPLDAALELAARVVAEDEVVRERTRAAVRVITTAVCTIGEQESAVLELVALGVSREDIAAKLGISLGTVGSHVCVVAKKARVVRVDRLVDRILYRLAIAANADAMRERVAAANGRR